MRKASHRRVGVIVCLGLALATSVVLLPGIRAQAPQQSQGWAHVDCDKEHPGALQRAIDAARPGDTVRVRGTCNENLLIPVSTDRLTLDGGAIATIHGPDPTLNTIQARAVRQLTITGFTITGGRAGVSIDRGASALINGNTIEHASRFGIIIGSWSTANIIFAFVGFGNADDTVASPNVIRFNGVHGINVTFSASARIAGNTISDNARNGVNVERASQATVSSNAIDHNGANGVFVTENSGVNLGSDSGDGLFDAPNVTTTNNIGSGVACRVGGYVNGRRGTLNGNAGIKSIGTSCIDSVDGPDTF